MTIIDGKETARAIKQRIAAEVEQMVAQGHRPPHLVAILVGHDGGSETYMANKVKACHECGITSRLLRFDADVSQERLLEAIDSLNRDAEVDGFIVQLPLPKHIDEQKVIESIDFRKDVDGFNPENVGRQLIGLPCFHSATPSGIMMLLEHYRIPTKGAHCVIVGRSNIVGKPMAAMMMQKAYPGDATVTVCHRATRNLAEITRQADILIAATGAPGSITADMVKEGAVVIDVGTTRVADPTRPSGYRLCGDVDFDAVAPKCSYITPVPGGVGPMTIVSLLQNTMRAAKEEIR